jgi:hypothetical protein
VGGDYTVCKNRRLNGGKVGAGTGALAMKPKVVLEAGRAQRSLLELEFGLLCHVLC